VNRSDSDLITIHYKNARVISDESDLQNYLKERLETTILVELLESDHWPITTLFLAPAAVPLAKYAGKKLIDVLADLLRKWLQDKPHISEIELYGPDGKMIKVKK
jgi:hypothetical protein